MVTSLVTWLAALLLGKMADGEQSILINLQIHL